MKNIFDYATKELSQDAFLRWFIESANNTEIEKEAKEFVCFLLNTKGDNTHKKYLPENISDFRTHAQVPADWQKIDIVVDYKFEGKDEIFIIEDKTVSSEHDDQLKTYKKVVTNWDAKRTANFIYYKTDFLNDVEHIKCDDLGYKFFDINDIYEYFSKIAKTKSEVLNDYIEHIKNLYNERTYVSDNPNTKEWNFYNWRTFFEQKIANKYDKVLDFFYGIYEGRYISSMIYFKNNDKFSYTTCLEMIFRDGDDISALVHPVSNISNIDKWKRDNAKAICYEIDNNLNSKFFKSYKKSQTVATILDKMHKGDMSKVELEISEVIDDFINSFSKFNIK